LFAAEDLGDAIELPADCDQGRHVFNQYCIRIAHGQRDAVLKGLQERQIGCAIYYPKPLHRQHCFQFLGGRDGQFPEAERAAAETIALPIYAELGAARQERVVQAVVESVADSARRSWTIPFRESTRKAA
jgi:dTDP-4-amino-4,6-dideoxygalactose transaminase